MHDGLAIADRKRMHAVERQVVYRRRAGTAHTLTTTATAPSRSYTGLADAQEPRRQPAMIRRQPRMVGGGVDRLLVWWWL